MSRAALCAVFLLLGCRESAEERPTSVVIIDIDTLRADRLGSYGNSRQTSPSIDALADAGTRFAWAFSQAPNTPPSQASILTGLYPYRHGRVGDFDAIAAEAPTIAELLHRKGLRTVAFVDGGHMRAGYGLERGFERYENLRGSGLRRSVPAALEWLDHHGQEPFLLLLHTYDVHSPYVPPEPLRTSFGGLVEEPTPGFVPTSEVLEEVRTANHGSEKRVLPERDIAYALSQYDAEIRFVDAWIHKFLVGLEERGLLARTLVVLLSDHGEEFQEHGSVLHEKLYATVTHVPLVFSGPGVMARSVERPVQMVDVVPTVLDVLGIEAASDFDGRSLAPLLRGQEQGATFAYAQSPFFGEERSLVVGPWRLHRWLQPGRVELYRYSEDPLEQVNLAPGQPQVVQRMSRALDSLEARVGRRREARRGPDQLDAETRQQLRALGYIQ